MSDYDIVIKGGTVFDGLQTPRYKADVAIKDGRIAQIGNVEPLRRPPKSSTPRASTSRQASSTCTRTTTASCSGTRGARCRAGTASPAS